jgi:hypothetical protein
VTNFLPNLRAQDGGSRNPNFIFPKLLKLMSVSVDASKGLCKTELSVGMNLIKPNTSGLSLPRKKDLLQIFIKKVLGQPRSYLTSCNGGGNESLFKSHFATNSANKFNIFITDTNVIPLT